MTKHASEFSVVWPKWVPEYIRNYILHTHGGLSIRTLARGEQSHPSTVLRQIRQIESDREDSLVDEAIAWLLQCFAPIGSKMETDGAIVDRTIPDRKDQLDSIANALPGTLRRLAQPKAVLAIASGMDRAVIVKDREDGEAHRLGVVERPVACILALNRWIECVNAGRISRYRITSQGRLAMNEVLAEAENRAGGFAEAQAPFGARPANGGTKRRYQAAETPVLALSRRRGQDGTPFLDATLVRAAERIQDDFELAQMEPRNTTNWDNYLTGGVTGSGGPSTPCLLGSAEARDRVLAALRMLGPGLGDVVLECCCKLQGLEAAEKKLGWSARSGKIVLRIALQRLRAHYDDLRDGGGLIG